MIMTDQDYDGSHIKGLLINLIQHWWPSLLKMDGFIKEFITPIVKVRKGKDEQMFFTLNEYHEWKRTHNNGKGWNTKYYKGLGTSTAKEAKEYFKALRDHRLSFKYNGPMDDQNIDLAFNKKRADDRKEWINQYVEGTFVDHSKKKIGYSDFINKELVQFSRYDVYRSIPSMVDGFKPTQRKVMFCAFKRNLKNDLKVAQFVGYISEHSAYHHGEASLENTIVGMAQDFVGSNNVNLLYPSGQFGTRLAGGKDSASSRYIYTRLAPLTRHIFHPDDDPILEYLEDEGQKIEPRFYVPIIPMVLVNGAEGIGTGWSTRVPCYSPRDLIHNCKRFIKGQPFLEMDPWYKGFVGEIKQNEGKGYDIFGVADRNDEKQTIDITELPLRTWTQPYKEWLQDLLPHGRDKDDDKKRPLNLVDVREYHTEKTVHFTVKLSQADMQKVQVGGMDTCLKLKSSLSTDNMMLFGEDGKITKHDNPCAIIEEFCRIRLAYYDKRKAHLLKKLRQEWGILSNRKRFILMIINDELVIKKKRRTDVIALLKQKGFKTMKEITAGDDLTELNKAPEAEGSDDGKKSDYDYLLNMNFWQLTMEKVDELEKQCATKEKEIAILMKTTVQQIWTKDLDDFEKALSAQEELDENEMKDHLRGARLKASKGAGKLMSEKDIKQKKPRKKKNADTSSEDEFSDDAPKRRKAAPATGMKAARLAPRASTGGGLGVRAPERKNMSVYVPGQSRQTSAVTDTSKTSSKATTETYVTGISSLNISSSAASTKPKAAASTRKLTKASPAPAEPPAAKNDVASLLSRIQNRQAHRKEVMEALSPAPEKNAAAAAARAAASIEILDSTGPSKKRARPTFLVDSDDSDEAPVVRGKRKKMIVDSDSEYEPSD